MILIERIITNDNHGWLTRYEEMGGVVDFKIARVTGIAPEREAHFEAAKATLSFIKSDIDNYYEALSASLDTYRTTYYTVVNSALTVNDGTPVTPEDFFGPFFNLEQQRPILQGQQGTPFEGGVAFDKYYYYNDAELPELAVTINIPAVREYVTLGYTDAFLSPPHSFGKGTNQETGQFFLDFSRFLFGELDKISVYAWPTDCSNYFDDGKEWWGSFFWTVYNAEKDWFVGIAASTTD